MAGARKNINNSTDDMYNVWIDNFSNKEKTIKETQEWADNLMWSTIDSSISTIWVKSNLATQEKEIRYEKDIHTLIWFLSAIDNLIDEVKDTRKWLSKKWLSKAWKRWIEEAKVKLKQYENQLNAKKNGLLNQAGREISDDEIFELKKIWNNLNEVRKDIGMSQRWYHENTASYLYNSPEIARKSNKHQADNLEFEQKLQTELSNWAIRNIFNRTTRNANEFYRKIAEWRYVRADYEFFMRNASVLAPSFQRCGITIPTRPIQHIWNWSNIENSWERVVYNWGKNWLGVERVQRIPRKSIDYSNMDRWETFEKWWVAGILDKLLTSCSNMTPWQKDTWKTLWVLGIVGWVLYGQYRFYTSKNIWLKTKIWLTVLPIFGSHFLTWKGPIRLFKELMTGWLSIDELKNKFGNAVWWLSASWSEAAETTVPAMQSMMIFNSWATAGDVQQMTQTFINDKSNNNRRNFYQQSCDKIQREWWASATESFKAIFSENFDEEKWEKWLASSWITQSTNNKETIHNLAENAYTNKVFLEKYLSDNNLKITTDTTQKAEFEKYIQWKNETRESIEIDDLKAHTDRFMPIDNGNTNQQNNNTQSNENSDQQSNNTQSNENSDQQNNNQQAPEEENNQNIELKNEILKVPVEKWLSTIFYYFKSEYWTIVSKAWIKQSSIPKYSPWITADIISKICKPNWNEVTLDLSDNNIKQVYDNFINKFANNHSWLVKKTIRNYDRVWLKSKLSKRGLKWEIKKYNKRKNNFSIIFDSLFKEIIPVIESQWWRIKIISNWQAFNNVNDAIKSLKILNNPYS